MASNSNVFGGKIRFLLFAGAVIQGAHLSSVRPKFLCQSGTVSNADSDNDISDHELDEIEGRAVSASPGPWASFVEGRDHLSGDTFIRIGGEHDNTPDMYASISEPGQASKTATASDIDFIVHARQDVPRLVAEIRRLKRIVSGLD